MERALPYILIELLWLGHCQLKVPLCCAGLATDELFIVEFSEHTGMDLRDSEASRAQPVGNPVLAVPHDRLGVLLGA